MTAAASRGPARWHEQEAVLGAEQSNAAQPFARPAVTTGATLPWGAQSSSTLGQPRAFYAGSKPVSTITVSSSSQLRPNVIRKAEPPAAAAVPSSPFADFVAPEMIKGQECSLGNSEDLEYYKQGSLQSTNTHCILEPSQAVPSGHVITTAQDDQGMAMTVRRSNGSRALTKQTTFQSSNVPPQQAAVVTTAFPSLKRHQSTASEAADEGHQQDDSLAKRQGLQSVPPPIPKEAPSHQYEQFQRSDSLSLDIRSTDVEGEDGLPNQEEQRRIRRRNNNRESAKRVREKRDADLKAVNQKIAKLQEFQAQLVEHCNSMDSDCNQLRQKLQQVQGRWESSQAENQRLKAEVEHLRNNVRVGEQSMLGVKSEHENMLMSPSDPGFKLSGGIADDLASFEWDKTFEQLACTPADEWRPW